MPGPLIVTVLAKKGGTGKTAVSAGLASAARKKGLNVWVADFDPQCNLTNLVAGDAYLAALAAYARREARRPACLFDVLDEDDPRAADLRMARQDGSPAWSGVSLLPASDKLDHIEHLTPRDGLTTRFARPVRELTGPGTPDLIICDTRPAFNLLTIMALAAADVGLVLVEPERFALEGLQKAWSTLSTLKQGGHLPHLRAAGVLRSKVDRRKSEHQQRLAEIDRAYGPVLWAEEMPERAAVKNAIGAGVPLHDHTGDRAGECTAVLDKWLTKTLEYAA